MATKVQRLAFGACPETCPAVDKAFSAAADDLLYMIPDESKSSATGVLEWLCEKVKEVGTMKLRAAMEDLADQLLELESERDSLLRDVSNLELKAQDLREEVKSLERELDKATA